MRNPFKNFFNRNRNSTEEYGSFDDHRVFINPAPARSGDPIHIHYNGLLKQSGADAVYLHYGVDSWQQITTVRMDRKEVGDFGIDLQVNADRELNFCFKDSASNWDNNSGADWKTEIHK